MNPTASALRRLCVVALLSILMLRGRAQTDVDAIMMNKNLFCVGAVYAHTSWKNYWEGTFRRDNQNLGTMTTQSYALMGTYGITNKLNVLFNVPYIETRASDGTLHQMKGLQDLSLMLKWMPVLKHVGSAGIVSAYAIGGVSAPMSNYVADYLPLSIGLRSKTASLRLMADYQLHHFFATASAAYMHRSNITIDRDAYYTTEMHYTNEVKMPDAAGFNVRAGYRSNVWVAEAVADNMTTLGGFDIRKNDMPFPSNKMNATRAGVNLKYSIPAVPGLELLGGGFYTLAGRNVGQSTELYGGVFYILNFSRRQTSNGNSKTAEQ